MSLKTSLAAAATILAVTLVCDSVAARESLRIVGSNTITSYAEVVAAAMVEQNFAKPEISPASTGPGIKHFCRGVGDLYPDISMAGRPMKDEEVADCTANGVTEVTEIKIGYDAILLSYRNDKDSFSNVSLTGRHIWLAMAKSVPVNGVMAANPYKNWNEIDPSLPAVPILLYMPDRDSAMREVIGKLVLEPVCAEEPAIAALPEDAREGACLTMREDSNIVEFSDSRDELTAMAEASEQPLALTNMQLMTTTPEAKSFKAAKIDGVEPTFATIASGEYKVTRTHFLYVKNGHIGKVPGVVEFVVNFLSDEAQGPNGYLTKMGLIPLKDDERKEMLTRISGLSN